MDVIAHVHSNAKQQVFVSVCIKLGCCFSLSVWGKVSIVACSVAALLVWFLSDMLRDSFGTN